MAAVAGAVADEVLTAMTAGQRLTRAYVNNGGDIAVHLGPGTSMSAGVVNDPDRPGLDERIVLSAEGPRAWHGDLRLARALALASVSLMRSLCWRRPPPQPTRRRR